MKIMCLNHQSTQAHRLERSREIAAFYFGKKKNET